MKQKVFFILSFFFVFLSFTPTFYELNVQEKMRPERYFELVHNFYTDYNFYLSRIRQGMEGNFLVHEKYTSEPHSGSLIHVLYVAMGWIGRFVHVPYFRPGDVYHVARFVFAMTLLLSFAAVSRKVFTSFFWQLIGYLLAVTACTWVVIVYPDGNPRFGGYMGWWSVMDSMQRISFIPHLLVGQTLIAVILLLGSEISLLSRWGNWIFIGGLAFLLGMVFPPGFVFITATFLCMIGIEALYEWKSLGNRALVWGRDHVASRAIIIVLGIPALLYLQYLVGFYPWKRLVEVDIIRPLPFNYIEYIKALGPMLPLGLVGLIFSFMRRSRLMILPSAWVVSWILLLVVFNFIPQQSPLRFSEMIPHLPLALLTAYFFQVLWKTAQKKRVLAYLVAPISFGIPLGLLLLGFGVMYSSWLWQRDFIDHKMRAAYPLVPTGSFVMYPLKDFTAAMWFLKDNTTQDTVILSEQTAGNYFPVYSGNTSYVGHDNTVKSEEKLIFVHAFYSNTMTTDQAKQWLLEEKLSYVFFGPEEKEDSGGKLDDLRNVYPFLDEIYQNTHVRIYKLSP